jgi:hypothetical protein
VSALVAPRRVLEPAALETFAVRLASSSGCRRALLATSACSRSYELIWDDPYVNAWLIRWSDDADTGFHDHDGSGAGIVVLEGGVVEERLALAGAPIARRFGAGASFHTQAAAIHRVRHGGGPSALTVHAYSPPLMVQGVYREGAGGALERRTVPYTEELRGELAVAS